MTPTPIYPSSKVAAGYNNTGSLTAWETIKPTGGTYFFAPVIFGLLDPGQDVIDLGGALDFEGFASSGILWTAITQLQVFYLQTTYCAGGFSGRITIEYRSLDPGNYVTANAILHLPKPANSQKKSRAYENYQGRLTRIAIIP
jgi:hypothetical protein